jgi:hypothetical protein
MLVGVCPKLQNRFSPFPSDPRIVPLRSEAVFDRGDDSAVSFRTKMFDIRRFDVDEDRFVLSAKLVVVDQI